MVVVAVNRNFFFFLDYLFMCTQGSYWRSFDRKTLGCPVGPFIFGDRVSLCSLRVLELYMLTRHQTGLEFVEEIRGNS